MVPAFCSSPNKTRICFSSLGHALVSPLKVFFRKTDARIAKSDFRKEEIWTSYSNLCHGGQSLLHQDAIATLICLDLRVELDAEWFLFFSWLAV